MIVYMALKSCDLSSWDVRLGKSWEFGERWGQMGSASATWQEPCDPTTLQPALPEGGEPGPEGLGLRSCLKA